MATNSEGSAVRCVDRVMVRARSGHLRRSLGRWERGPASQRHSCAGLDLKLMV